MARLPWQRTESPDIEDPAAETTVDTASLGELVARVADDSGDRKDQLAALARGLAGGVKGAAGSGFRGAGSLLADVLADAAPRLRIRDAATLRAHHPGLSDDELADVLVRNAARTTAAFGAAVGALAAVEFAAPPALLAAPVQLAAETLAVAAVEVKLVAELHEISGLPAYGNGTQRGSAYLMSWVRQRALDPQAGAAGLSAVLGHAAKRELRTMLVRRAGRSAAKLAPFFAGAVAGGVVNRRVTRSLGEKLTAELRGRRY
ncbi:MAG TPA: hypothetical protein VLM05_15800 [Mycobacteriales bacterium]|nr:hypothetical protein [Mycobacteriales bacterium]